MLHTLLKCLLLPAVAADAATAANEAAAAALRQLSQDLSGTAAELAAAMQLGVLLVTIQEHSRAATAAGWSVPLVGGKEQQEARASSSSRAHPEHDGVLQLRGLWPYWVSGGDVGTVRNDVGLDGFMLLTGPNMAGEEGVGCAGRDGGCILSFILERGLKVSTKCWETLVQRGCGDGGERCGAGWVYAAWTSHNRLEGLSTSPMVVIAGCAKSVMQTRIFVCLLCGGCADVRFGLCPQRVHHWC
jgi:hypothetical protein